MRQEAHADKRFVCTDCGGDATIALSDTVGPKGQIIRADERLCLRCAKKRGFPHPLLREKEET